MTEKMYNQCVNEYADNVYRFIWKNLRHEEDAKDIVQSAFEKLWVNRAQVAEGKEKSYLFTIAYHQMIDHIRKNKRIDLQEDFGEELMGRIKQPNAMGNQNLMKALEQLNELQKSLVMLKDYEGYSYQEIGEITGLHESQVKVYIFRARAFLKKYIGSLERVI